MTKTKQKQKVLHEKHTTEMYQLGMRHKQEIVVERIMELPLLYGMPEPTVSREDVLQALITKNK